MADCQPFGYKRREKGGRIFCPGHELSILANLALPQDTETKTSVSEESKIIKVKLRWCVCVCVCVCSGVKHSVSGKNCLDPRLVPLTP